MEVWEVVQRFPDDAEIVVGVHVDEADAISHLARLDGEGKTAILVRAEMGECGCGG